MGVDRTCGVANETKEMAPPATLFVLPHVPLTCRSELELSVASNWNLVRSDRVLAEAEAETRRAVGDVGFAWLSAWLMLSF